MSTWALVHANGGHPGNTDDQASIRRWIASRDGVVTVSGKFKHLSANGNGVRARLISSRLGTVGEWTTKNNEAATAPAPVGVQAGDTLDFVVDALGDSTSDSFEWIAHLKVADSTPGAVMEWDTAADFHGPLTGASLVQQIAYAWPIAYQRPVSAEELELACQFINSQLAALKANGDKTDHTLSALTSLCQQLLSSNEFLHVD